MEHIYVFMIHLHIKKARQKGDNVNPFGAMASVAGDRSGPWTGWISPAPVVSGYCLGAMLW